MNKLERLKVITKILTLVGIVILEKNVVDLIVPKNPIFFRRILVIGGTVMLVDISREFIFRHIDKHFNTIISDIEKDAATYGII